MTNNVSNPNTPETNPLNENPIQTEPNRTDGYNEAVKQGQSMKIVMAVLIVLVLAVLVGYILMNFLGGTEKAEIIVPTVVPSAVTTVEEGEPFTFPTNVQITFQDFSYPVFIPDTKDHPYIISGKALSDAIRIPSDSEDSASFTIRGEGYQLNVGGYFESETQSYTDYEFLAKVGNETIARIKDEYLPSNLHDYRYVRSYNINETEDCSGMGPDTKLTAPCGHSHYISGNEVETFYILDITCDADEINVSKCDDIVKSLEVQY